MGIPNFTLGDQSLKHTVPLKKMVCIITKYQQCQNTLILYQNGSAKTFCKCSEHPFQDLLRTSLT